MPTPTYASTLDKRTGVSGGAGPFAPTYVGSCEKPAAGRHSRATAMRCLDSGWVRRGEFLGGLATSGCGGGASLLLFRLLLSLPMSLVLLDDSTTMLYAYAAYLSRKSLTDFAPSSRT
jgi:hypothetical protein